MPGNILIVDQVAINRIVLKVKLVAAFYTVQQAASGEEARRLIGQARYDLVLIGDSLPGDEAEALLEYVADRRRTTPLPSILITADATGRARLRALERGAADVFIKPVEDAVLLARLRNLVRRSDRVREMELREAVEPFVGYGEAANGTDGPNAEVTARIALVSPRARHEASMLRRLRGTFGLPDHCVTPAQILTSAGAAADWDVLVLELPGAPHARDLALLSDLRARSVTGAAGVVVMMPDGHDDLVASGFDLGADDVVPEAADPREIAIRVDARLREKRRLDGYRTQLRDGMRASVIDPLTGLFNRRYAEPQLRRILAAACSDQSQCAVMLADVDHFKAVNDRYGHAAGDAVLCDVAERLRQSAGRDALVARTGGEEFLIVMPNTTAQAALTRASQMCEQVRRDGTRVDGLPTPLRVTISVGVAMADGADAGHPPERVIDRADKAMYAAKSHGRDRATCLRPAA